MTATATVDPPDLVYAIVEVGGNRMTFYVDPAADLGDVTAAEAWMMTAYVMRSGLAPDRARAGAALLVQICRKLTVPVPAADLLDAVT